MGSIRDIKQLAKIGAVILMVFAVMSMAQAALIRQSHNVTYDTTVTDTLDRGNNVSIKDFVALGYNSVCIQSATKAATDAATKFKIFNGTATTQVLIASCTFSGSNCSFSPQFCFNPNSRYRFMLSADGASHNQRYKSGDYFPLNDDLMLWDEDLFYNAGWIYSSAPYYAWGATELYFNVTIAGATPSEPPSLTLSTDLVSGINSSLNPYQFNFTGTLVNNTNSFNCTLYLNNTLNQTLSNVPLNGTWQGFNLTYGSQQTNKDINVTCRNALTIDSFVRTNVFLDSVYPRNNITPYSNNTKIYRGVDLYINYTIFCDDPNLFSCNSTLMRVNSTGQLNETINTTIVQNINTTTYNITLTREILTISNGLYAAVVTSIDSHTSPDPVKPLSWYFSGDNLIIEGSVTWEGDFNRFDGQGRSATYFYIAPEGDKYKLKMTFDQSSLIHYLNISSPDLYYRADDGYKGHFVYAPTNRWIDHEGANVKSVTVTPLGSGKYGLRVEHYTVTDEIEFESVGDLNIQKDIYYLNLTENIFGFQMFIYNEDTPSQALVGTAEVEFNYRAGNSSNVTNYNAAFSGSNTYVFNISTNESLITGDLYIVYNVPAGFTHRYIVVNTTFNTTQFHNFTLYNFNTTTGISDLKITTRYNSNYKYYPEVIAKLQRKYVSEGVWRTVQMDESGDFGQLFFNIKEESTDYKLIFTDTDNNILKTTESLKFVCTSGICDLTVLLDPYEATSGSTGITYGYSYNPTTKIVNVTWTDAAAGTSTVQIKARQDTVTGAFYPCNQTQSGAAGSMTCNLTGRQGVIEFTVIANGDLETTELIEIKAQKLGDVAGNDEGAFWAVMIILICLMFGLFSPVAAIISMMVGLVTIYLLGLFTPITITFLIIVTVIGIVIGIKVRS